MNDVPVAIDVYAARFEAGGLFFFKLGAGSDKHDELRAEQLTVTIPVAADDAKKQQSKQSRS